MLNLVFLSTLLSNQALADRYAADDTAGSITFDMEASLHGINGKAKLFSAEFNLGDEGPLTGKLSIDASALTTHLGVRDDRMYSYCLETDRYPTVEFQVADMKGDVDALRSKSGSGSVTMHGQLKVRSSSRDIEVPATFAWNGDQLHVEGTKQIKWDAFGVPDPSIMISTLYPEVKVAFALDLKARP